MRIAVHAGTLRGYGSAAVGRGVLAGFAHSDHEVFAWVPESWQQVPGLDPSTVRRVGSGFVRKAWFENVELRRALFFERIDRLFAMTDTTLPECPVPQLLMVQQAFLAYRPEEWGFGAPARFRAKMALMAAYFRAAMKTVTLFTVQTEDMRHHLAERWRISEDRIVVVPSSIPAAHVAPALERVVKPIDAPYVCYVANAAPHKNHGVLAEMMAELVRSHPELRCKLTVLEQEVPRLVSAAKRLGVRDRFEFCGSLGAGELVELYRGATLAVIPSLLESFGMGYWEAMSHGLPLVVADRGFSREACLDAALYADGRDGRALAEAARRILGEPAVAGELALAARARFAAANLTWEEIARRYLALLGDLA